MEILKRITRDGSSICLFVKIELTAAERERIDRLGLWNTRIRDRDRSLGGRTWRSRNQRSAYRSQLGHIRGRWDQAVLRTSGMVLTDLIFSATDAIRRLIDAIGQRVMVQRLSLADVARGITVRATRIEQVKETEVMIFASLYSITQAIDYADEHSSDRHYGADELLRELPGLDFSGFSEGKRNSNILKYLRIAFYFAVAFIAAMIGLGKQLEQTFDNVSAQAEIEGNRGS